MSAQELHEYCACLSVGFGSMRVTLQKVIVVRRLALALGLVENLGKLGVPQGLALVWYLLPCWR